MCEANAYVVNNGKEELLMEAVDIIEPEDDKNLYRLVSIFGDQKIIKGKIIGMNLVNHKILFERAA
ncbi:MAG: CooT family nickel-binding protein [Desulfamplus sp.]